MPGGGILTIETANIILDETYCRLHPDITPGEHVMLSISDTGSGIEKDLLDHIFDPFFTTKAMGRGTGMGLATVYGAVKQNGGNIDVYSEVDTGTCFKVVFPRDSEKPSEITTLDTGKIPGGSETILLVEDNALTLKFSLNALNTLGYRVLAAVTGEDAVHLADQFPGSIHMLITDVSLPDMNGYELSEAIKKKSPETKVLYKSGHTENTHSSGDPPHSSLNFIEKPFSTFALAHKLREILDKI
jgi:CheY-like chemotaxis protein